MPPSVLGKRRRNNLDNPEKENLKRRLPFVISNDENINPFVSSPASTPQKRARTTNTPHTVGQNVYNEARHILRKSAGRLVGREVERDELEAFVSTRLSGRKSGAIYISGPPGTGKSATVTEVLENLCQQPATRTSFVNCVSLKDASGVYAKLLADFDALEVLQDSELSALQKLFHMKDRTHLVVLDEVDHLLAVDLDFLYNIFQWSLQKSSNLILIGIANALDFTDRFLPRLRSKGLKPQLLPFMPYTVTQITSILSTKLKSTLPIGSSSSADFVPFIHPMALQFAAKKVAAQTGDLRKAFSLCIRAIDLVESETRAKSQAITPSPSPSPPKKPLAENKSLSPIKSPLENLLSSPSRTPRRHNIKSLPSRDASDTISSFTVDSAPRATIAHMARVTATVFSNGTSTRLASLNLQQKAALCTLCVLEAKHRSNRRNPVDSNGNPTTPSKKDTQLSAPTMKMLYETYSQLCKRDNAIHAITNTEFRDVVGSLEAQSLVTFFDSRNGSLTPSRTSNGTPSRRGRGSGGFGRVFSEDKRVTSSVGFNEVRESLNGPGADVLRDLMNEEKF